MKKRNLQSVVAEVYSLVLPEGLQERMLEWSVDARETYMALANAFVGMAIRDYYIEKTEKPQRKGVKGKADE